VRRRGHGDTEYHQENADEDNKPIDTTHETRLPTRLGFSLRSAGRIVQCLLLAPHPDASRPVDVPVARVVLVARGTVLVHLGHRRPEVHRPVVPKVERRISATTADRQVPARIVPTVTDVQRRVVHRPADLTADHRTSVTTDAPQVLAKNVLTVIVVLPPVELTLAPRTSAMTAAPRVRVMDDRPTNATTDDRQALAKIVLTASVVHPVRATHVRPTSATTADRQVPAKIVPTVSVVHPLVVPIHVRRTSATTADRQVLAKIVPMASVVHPVRVTLVRPTSATTADRQVPAMTELAGTKVRVDRTHRTTDQRVAVPHVARIRRADRVRPTGSVAVLREVVLNVS